jgi:hypothetical protein
MSDGRVMDDSWIGVDLDGTLAYYDDWKGEEHIGDPVPLMIQRVREWITSGRRVKIFTARAGSGARQIEIIQDWCELHGLPRLEVTNVKDFKMTRLWDDRAVQVIENSGIPVRREE